MQSLDLSQGKTHLHLAAYALNSSQEDGGALMTHIVTGRGSQLLCDWTSKVFMAPEELKFLELPSS